MSASQRVDVDAEQTFDQMGDIELPDLCYL